MVQRRLPLVHSIEKEILKKVELREFLRYGEKQSHCHADVLQSFSGAMDILAMRLFNPL
jgi:hypothetical protein